MGAGWPARHRSRTLLLLQITLSSVSGHASTFWASNEKLRSLWADKLGPSRVVELWVTPDTDAGAGSKHVGQYVCTLAELRQRNQALFPLLRIGNPPAKFADHVGVRTSANRDGAPCLQPAHCWC